MEERSDFRTAIIFGVTAGFLIAVGNLYWQLEKTRTELANLRLSTQSEVTKLSEEAHQVANRKPGSDPNKKILDSIREEMVEQLSSTKTQAAIAAQHAKEAMNHANQVAAKLGEETMNQHKEVLDELGHLKELEASASARVNDVTADVATIKTDVADTRQELKQAVSELKQVTGDMGVQSGLIATNARELQLLRTLGERNYFDFHIERNAKAQKVGGVSLALKKTDTKKGRYTLQVLADDKNTEKKEKAVNEPVQFYVNKGRVLYEIVVNEVQKDSVSGYLATPKDTLARNN